MVILGPAGESGMQLLQDRRICQAAYNDAGILSMFKILFAQDIQLKNHQAVAVLLPCPKHAVPAIRPQSPLVNANNQVQ